MKNAIMMGMLFLLAGLSGCMADEEPPSLIEDMVGGSKYNYTDSYQFNNYAPMGMGNTTQITLNETNMSVWVEVNMSASFHQPLVWEQGSVNVSILDNNGTVLWSNESNTVTWRTHMLVVSDNYSYNGNLTLKIMADGSDNATDENVADWYVVRYDIWCEWREY